ncbi:MAG: beta-propeller fold lactonase family protein [Candidatus Symbiothrix sp.]|jgi:YVTN family beta-propeller protein|nr:beta-propeller fold lactonase family protein [Candidatus Symbiothrix sp.]
MRKRFYILLLAICFAFTSADRENVYLSPGTMAVDANRQIVYTALTTAKAIAVTDYATKQTTGQIKLKQNPNSILLSSDGSTLYVSSGETKGLLEIVALPQQKVKATIQLGHTPEGMVQSSDGNFLYVANRFSNSISVIDLKSKKVIKDIPVVREPRNLSISPDGKTLVAGNFLPAQAATSDVVAAEITLIDATTNSIRTNVLLTNGAQSVMGIAFSPDGNYVYAVHLLSRYMVPITQLDRGWVNTNALSIIDVKDDTLYATVLLDDVDRGAANPAGIGIGKDNELYIALAGSHELMVLDLKALHEKLSGLFDGKIKDAYIHDKNDLSASLSFTSSLKKRIALKGRLPQNLAFTEDAVLVSSRFSPFIEKVSYTGSQLPESLVLGEEPEPNTFRRGELAFNDASICYQQWHTCASCHPDGRADGLNWDQQNDDWGNPKNTKSLLFSHLTPPCMITGIRASAELAVRKGILHTLQTDQPEALAVDIDEYLKNMPVVESPFIKEYKKKDAKQKGKKLFEQAGCIQCHNGQYYTDLTKYDVGTGDGDDEGRLFDTPSLRETWRTAPYLYDGRAATLKEVFTKYNSGDRHGATKNLSKEELEALILYINTL